MLYFNDHCRPGSEWIRFTSKRMFRNLRWTAEDEKEPYTPWLALPGRDNLGLGRFWHFVSVVGWLLTGLAYLLVLFTSEQWHRLVPTSASVFHEAAEAAVAYLRLDVPPPGNPYNGFNSSLTSPCVRAGTAADHHRSGDVPCTRRSLSVVPSAVRRETSGAEPAFYWIDRIRGVHGPSCRSGDRSWSA